MNRPNVFVVDDDDSLRTYLGRFLASRGYDVESVNSGERAIARLRQSTLPSALILDLIMPKVSGLDVLEEMGRMGCSVPTVVLSGMGQVQTVVKAVRLGAADFLVKPFEEEDLERAIRTAVELKLHSDGIPPFTGAPGEMFSRNDRMLRIRDIATQVADTDVPVLITGESGVGKEVLAHHIHASSTRSTEPFIKVNCAALPADLLESELFGYERGAFTGAMREKPGKFELAGKGTILLDEIGEMSPALQAKLLHVLQDGEYTPLGGARASRAQARILAATNQRLEDNVGNGSFREDLYFRLNVIRLEVPPLRDRPEDIMPLCERFLEIYHARYRRPVRSLSPEMMSALQTYSWPGNIRELENVIKRFVILPDLELTLADLHDVNGHGSNGHATPPPAAINQPRALPISPPPGNPSLKKVSAEAAERAEREIILRTLEQVNWNRKEAARRLSISYKALLNKLRRWNIGGRTKTADVA
jgi:two-component system, NtrC family, response regulator AtoC